MARFTSNFVCQQCGYVSPSFLGKCPNCDSWNSFSEEVIQTGKTSRTRAAGSVNTSVKPIKLSEIKAEQTSRVRTEIAELDRVLGGGLVPGMAVLISGEPGIGKSTLLLQLAEKIKGPVIYVAGEESASQIKIRATRLGVKADNLLIIEDSDADEVIHVQAGAGKETQLIIVDSIQTMTTSDLVGVAGSVGQVRECAARLIGEAKRMNVPLILVGHVTKEGTIAGPKVLEHAVDTVLNFEGEKSEGLRLIRATKNRFGATDEVGVFEMTDTGLIAVRDINGLLTEGKDANEPGKCLAIAMEGTRPILVEIQALSTSTPMPIPRRVASGVNYNRLQTIIAILQKRLSIPLYKEDVYVSVSGGLTISEPAMDLPIALSILTSFRNKSLPKNTVAMGEIDLLGSIRKVNSQEKRIKEAKTLGFKNILTSETLPTLAKFNF